MRIKKNDTVIVISGKDSGKNGTVIDIKIDKGLVKVKGIALVTKHVKARKQGEVSTIKKVESFINLSNVMLVSSADSLPCRVNFKIMEDGKKMRICNRTKEAI